MGRVSLRLDGQVEGRRQVRDGIATVPPTGEKADVTQDDVQDVDAPVAVKIPAGAEVRIADSVAPAGEYADPTQDDVQDVDALVVVVRDGVGGTGGEGVGANFLNDVRRGNRDIGPGA